MSTYRMILRPAAQRDLDRLSDSLCKRVLKAIERLGAEPRARGVRKLVGGERE